jgi:hypothetical protein
VSASSAQFYVFNRPTDDFPHPNDPTLASTMPHHKHIPPDIKHHRIPAPSIGFDRPNLPLLLREIEAMVEEQGPE